MANEKTPVVWDDTTKKHRPLGTGEKMGGLDASSIISSDSGNLIQTGSDGLALVTGSSLADPRADNLLETSGNGKLQVTVDRIAEWLDGHPQDAAILADAINVVSGDSGNVIVEGTDKGAFLSKGAIAAAVAGMTDAQKAQLADAIAARIAADIADGKTIVASGGKLTADPTNATAAQKKAINQALADADSGLVVDPSTGRLQVDFSNMPTDKFEELLKGLKMLVPLSADKNLYVSTTNAAASDVLDDGRGTAAKPFKHIQACVDYAASTYSLGRYNLVIRVVAGTYNETVVLPEYSRGTGSMYIIADSGSRDVTINAAPDASGFVYTAVRCTGGLWHLRNLALKRTEIMFTGEDTGQIGCVAHLTGESAHLDFQGCLISQQFPSGVSSLPGVQYTVRIIYVDNGARVTLSPWSTPSAIVADSLSGTRSVVVFSVSRSSSVLLSRPPVTSANQNWSREFACSGSMTIFMNLAQGSSVNSIGGGPKIDFSGTMTGKRYDLVQGSYSATGQGATYFPGDVAGTLDENTYCWYA